MYKIEFTNEMRRNVKLMRKRGKDISKFNRCPRQVGERSAPAAEK